MKQKGGILPVILFLVLAAATIGLATFALRGKTAFAPRASNTSETTIINKDLGVNVKLTSDDHLKVTWPNLYKNDDRGGKSLTSIQIIARSLTDNEHNVLPKGRIKLITKEELKTTSYVFDQLALPPRLSFSITLRATYGNAQTVYVDSSSYKYNRNKKTVKKDAKTTAEKELIGKFGLAGYVDITKPPMENSNASYFWSSGAKLKSSLVSWKGVQANQTDDIVQGLQAPVYVKEFSHCHDNLNDQCLILFHDSPDWATKNAQSNGAGSGNCVPIDSEAFDAFAQAAAATVKTYGKNTVGIELYNEPDFAFCYGGSDDVNNNGKVDVEDYATLVAKAYVAIKAVDPDYPVLVGRLALDPGFNKSSTGNCDILPKGVDCTRPKTNCNTTEGATDLACQKRQFQAEFLPQFIGALQKMGYNESTPAPFDYLDLHYYEGYWGQHQSREFVLTDAYSNGGIRGKTFWARTLLKTIGSENIPIIYSEMGSATRDPSGGGPAISEELQADQVFRLFSAGLSAGVKSMSWYCFVDGISYRSPCENPPGSDVPYYSYRLIKGTQEAKNMAPRKAFTAYATIAAELQDFDDFDNTDKTPGIEGYIFKGVSEYGDGFKEVLWARCSNILYPAQLPKGWGCKTDGNPPLSIPTPMSKTFVTNKLTLINPEGKRTVIQDGQEGDIDGKRNFAITLTISSPVIAVWN